MDKDDSATCEDSNSQSASASATCEDSSSYNRDDDDDLDAVQMGLIFSKAFEIKPETRLEFPEFFRQIPTHLNACLIWSDPMHYSEISDRLLGKSENVGPYVIPEEFFDYFSVLTNFATAKYEDLLQQFEDNEHHIETLAKFKSNNSFPPFLLMQSPKIRFFPEAETKELENSLQKRKETLGREMLQEFLDKRLQMRNNLVRSVEPLKDELQNFAVEKWLEAQANDWNAWDQLYPSVGIVKQKDKKYKFSIPISTVIFRAALAKCKSDVSNRFEQRRKVKAEKARKKIKEQKLRREIMEKTNALPLEEAEKSIEQRVQDIVQPLITDIKLMKEQMLRNQNAPKMEGTLRETNMLGNQNAFGTFNRKITKNQETLKITKTNDRNQYKKSVEDRAQKQGGQQNERGRKTMFKKRHKY